MNLDSMVKIYNSLEEKIIKEIGKLPSYGNECNCDDQNEFTTIFFGEFENETQTFCLNCGGYILDR